MPVSKTAKIGSESFIRANKKAKSTEEHKLSSSISGKFDQNQTHLKAWFNNIDLSVFRPGEQELDLGFSIAYRKQLLDFDSKYFISKFSSSASGFGLVPEDNFEKRLVSGLSASASLFLGGKYLVGPFEFRVGGELRPAFYYGKNLSELINVPFNLGFSSGIHFNKDSSLWLSAKNENYITLGDVQNANDLTPFKNKTEIALSIDTSSIGFKLFYDLYNYGAKSLRANLTIPINNPFGSSVDAYIGVDAGYNTSGGNPNNWIVKSDNYIGFTFGLDWAASSKNDIGTSFRASFGQKNPIPNAYASINKNKLSDDGNYPSSVSKGKRFKCVEYGKGLYGLCELEGVNGVDTEEFPISCLYIDSNTVRCFFEKDFGEKTGYYVDGNLLYSEDSVTIIADTGVDDVVYSLTGDMMYFEISDFDNENVAVSTIMKSNNLLEFISNSKKFNAETKLEILNELAKQAYKTYDGQGLLVPNGSGQVNSIGSEDLYSNIRSTFINNKKKPTTVCRGFAKFISTIADKLGFESHSVTIQTQGSGHVINLLREKGSDDNYSVINYGRQMWKAYSKDISEVIQKYCLDRGYPPQLQNWVFDSSGKPEGVIESSTFKMLQDAVETKPQLDDFLFGK